MSASLNTGNTYVTYDLRLDPYIDEHEFDGEIVLNFTLPFLLPKINDVYYIMTSEEYFKADVFNKSPRRVVFAGTRNWSNDQNISARHSTISVSPQGNTVLTTSLTIAIEVMKQEFKSISELISKADILEEKLKEIIQDSLEIILVKYNECAEGKSFKTPSYFDCDRIHVQFFKNYFAQRFKVWEYVTPNDTSPDGLGIDESPILREQMEKDILTWKYFFNKANYHFLCKEHLDSIISAAIAVESYAFNVIKSFCYSEEEEKDYTSEKVIGENGEKRISFLPMHKLYKKLKADGYIYTSLSNTKLDKCISKILNPRNDIMHGKRKINSPLNEEASDVNKYVNILFDTLESKKNIVEEKEIGRVISCNEMQKIYSVVYNTSVIIEERIKLVRSHLEKYPTNLVLQQIYNKLEYIKGNKEEAITGWTEMIIRCKNKSALAIEIGNFCYSQGDIDLSLEFLNQIPFEDQDERWNAFNAFLNFEKYLLVNETRYIAVAIEQVELAKAKRPYYEVAHYISRDIAYKINDILKARDFSRLLNKLCTRNYESILFSAECNKLMGEKYECYNDFSSFIEVFRENHHASHVVDFYKTQYDSTDIYSRTLSVYLYLLEEWKEDEDRISSLKEVYKEIRRIELAGELSYASPKVFMQDNKNSYNFLVKSDFPSLGAIGSVKDSITVRYLL